MSEKKYTYIHTYIYIYIYIYSTVGIKGPRIYVGPCLRTLSGLRTDKQ